MLDLLRQRLLGTSCVLAMLLASPAVHSEPGPQAPEPGEVLATFTGGVITRADYEQVLNQRSPSDRARFAKPGGREALLESMIRYDLLALEAERRGYGERLEVKVAERKEAGDRMLMARLAVDPTSIARAEVEQAYAARKHEFGRPRMRRATQIKVATEAEATALIAQLARSDRERFARVAREKNLDVRARNQGGELGYFARDGKTESGRPTGVPERVVEEVFALRRVGDISRRPVAHDGAFSVLMLTGEMPEIAKSFAELEPVLREQLAAQKEKRALDALLQELRTTHRVEVSPELVDAIVLPPPQSRDMPEGFAAAPPDPRAPPVFLEPDGI